MNTKNLILLTDSYKFSHFKQDPPGTTNKFFYVEARGTNLDYPDAKTLFVGYQPFLKEYLSTPITYADIAEAKEIVEAHGFEFNEKGWKTVVEKYDGYLPLRIRAVKEGSAVPLGNILMSLEATDPEFAWLPSYIETALLRAIWYPTTVASNGLRAKRILKQYMDDTADYAMEELNFKLHDFGARGVSSHESAQLGGMAHLVNFSGTDTIEGAMAAMKYYGGPMPGFSIPASEHSTITSWGKFREQAAYANMLTQFGGEGKMLACVSDSYDIDHATDVIWGQNLKEAVEKMGGTLVVRPDSGDPLVVPITVIETLMNRFGYTINSKGYKVLPDCVRVIQGDGITVDSMRQILENMKERGLSASNIAFGMGAGTLQKVDRDTYKFAMKCSAIRIYDNWHGVWKEAPGKASKRGRMTLVRDAVTKEYRTIGLTDEINYHETDQMQTIYMNGPLESGYTSFINLRSEAFKGL